VVDAHRKTSEVGTAAGANGLPPSSADSHKPPLPDSFYNSETYRCILKEKETISFVKRAGLDIETELVRRKAASGDLKRRLQELLTKEKHLLMAIEGAQVQNELDLCSLQYARMI
jgi:hypothetical protein